MSDKICSQSMQDMFVYPTQADAESVLKELSDGEERFKRSGHNWRGAFPHISSMLSDAALAEEFPEHQLLGWLRIAAAFRRSVEEQSPGAGASLAALEYFRKNLKKRHRLDVRAKVNWALDHTLNALGLNFEGGWVKEAMTDLELAELQKRLNLQRDNSKFDVAVVETAIRDQLRVLSSFSVLARLTNLDRKIEGLLEAASGGDDAAGTAQAALNYVASVEDVIPDDSGILGLLDDLYAVEWAYAVVEQHTLGLPLLDVVVGRWPYLNSSYLMAGGRMMDRFAQYAMGTAHLLLEEGNDEALVLRDAATYIIPIAASLALRNLRRTSAKGSDLDWQVGCVLNLTDYRGAPLRAKFLGRSRIGTRKTIMLDVAQSGRIHVAAELGRFMQLAPRHYERLSKGQAVIAWERNRRLDPLHFLLNGAPRSEQRRAVLVVAPKNIVERLLPSLTCRGEPMATTIGASWVKASGTEEPMLSSISGRPMLFACATADTAKNLIVDPPVGVEEFDVVTFGARTANQLRALLSGEGCPPPPLLQVCDLAERPGPGARAYRIEDLDVVPFSESMRGFGQHNALARGFARQRNHWIFSHKAIEILDAHLSAISALLDRADLSRDPNPAFVVLDSMLRRFLFDAGQLPFDQSSDEFRLKERAAQIAQYAGTLTFFDENCARIAETMTKYVECEASYPDLVGYCGLDKTFDERTVVLARSAKSATELSNWARKNGLPLIGVTLGNLLMDAPFKRLVVPGWFGGETMRRIMVDAPAEHVEILLFTFQKKWFDGVMAGARRLGASYRTPLTRFNQQQGDKENEKKKGPIWPSPREEEKSLISNIPEDEEPIVDGTPDVSAVFRFAKGSGDVPTDCCGIPVLLDVPGKFVLLPPNGLVMVLPDENDDRSIRDSDILAPVQNLKPGAVFALKDGSHRDLLGEFAEFFLDEPEVTLELANLWRAPLVEAFEAGSHSWSAFKRSMKEIGLKRSDMTYRNWLTGETIAPRDYETVIPLLGEVAAGSELKSRSDDVVSAIRQLYSTRSRAASTVIEEVMAGNVDWSKMQINASFGSVRSTIKLYRALAVGGPIDCHRADIWRVQTIQLGDAVGKAFQA